MQSKNQVERKHSALGSSFSDEGPHEKTSVWRDALDSNENQREVVPGLKWWEILLSPFRVLASVIFNPLLTLMDFISTRKHRSLVHYQLAGSLIGAVIGAGVFLNLLYLTPFFAGMTGGVVALASIGYGLSLAFSILFKVVGSNIWKYRFADDGLFRKTKHTSSGLLISLHGLRLENKIAFSIVWNFFFSPLATLFTFLAKKDSTNTAATLGAWIGALIGALFFILFFLPISPIGLVVHLGIASAAKTMIALAIIGYSMILLPAIFFKGVGIAALEEQTTASFVVKTACLGRDIATATSLQSHPENVEDKSLTVANRRSSTARILDAQGGPSLRPPYELESEDEDLRETKRWERIDCSPEEDEVVERAQRKLKGANHDEAPFRRSCGLYR